MVNTHDYIETQGNKVRILTQTLREVQRRLGVETERCKQVAAENVSHWGDFLLDAQTLQQALNALVRDLEKIRRKGNNA